MLHRLVEVRLADDNFATTEVSLLDFIKVELRLIAVPSMCFQ